jgi:hypothetical protein
MKRHSFASGHEADRSFGMVLEVDRSRLPQDMALGLWLDEEHRAVLPQTPMSVHGGMLAVREGRRFAHLHEAVAAIHVEKQPRAVYQFTLEAERPPDAKPGDRYLVHVAQKTPAGVTVGGISVEFRFD